MELVSICVTTYNRASLITNTIQSVLNQTYTNFEILIVDDFSTDSTQELVKNELIPLYSRIHYFRHTENKGLASARNTAIFNSKGKYFTFIDDDDLWENNFLEIFVKVASNFDTTYSFCTSIISKKQEVKSLKASVKSFVQAGYTPPVASQFYFTNTLKSFGGYDVNIKSGVDHDLWFTLAHNNYNLVWLNKKLSKVNKIESSNRMTFNYNKRVNGIKKSLIIWEKRIGDSFGEGFFMYLKENYDYNTYKKFIIHSAKKKNFILFIELSFKLPKKLFFLDLKRFVKSKINKKSLLIHPTFNLFSKSKIEIINDDF